jgi:hypothetical protein
VHIKDAAVVFEFFRRTGCAVPVQVGRRGDEHAPAGRQAPRDEIVIRDRTMADDGIVSVRGRVDPAVVQLERQLDPGVLREKRIERGPQVHAAERHRRGDAQRTAQLPAPLGQVGRGLLHVAHDAHGAREEGGTVLGQRELARGPLQQAGAERPLQLDEAFADDGTRHAQPARRFAQGTAFGHRDERGDAFQFHARAPVCSAFPNCCCGI